MPLRPAKTQQVARKLPFPTARRDAHRFIDTLLNDGLANGQRTTGIFVIVTTKLHDGTASYWHNSQFEDVLAMKGALHHAAERVGNDRLADVEEISD